MDIVAGIPMPKSTSKVDKTVDSLKEVRAVAAIWSPYSRAIKLWAKREGKQGKKVKLDKIIKWIAVDNEAGVFPLVPTPNHRRLSKYAPVKLPASPQQNERLMVVYTWAMLVLVFGAVGKGDTGGLEFKWLFTKDSFSLRKLAV